MSELWFSNPLVIIRVWLIGCAGVPSVCVDAVGWSQSDQH